jgi:hypothetical protein
MLDLEDIVSTIFFVHCKSQIAKEQFLIRRAKRCDRSPTKFYSIHTITKHNNML